MTAPADNPIRDKRDDLLGRDAVAAVIADEIRHLDVSEGCVVGILGPWGSGKTSLINLVREYVNKDPVFAVFEFNPWMFSGTDELLAQFFLEIGAQFRGRSERLRALASDLEAYSDLVAPLRLLLLIGPTVERARTLLKTVNKALERRKLGALHQRELLSKRLADLDAPIVIAVDDIDRLRTAEIRAGSVHVGYGVRALALTKAGPKRSSTAHRIVRHT